MKKNIKFTITIVWILLTRWFDAFSTYRHTPDLGKEANPLVSIFGFGWTPLLVVIVVLSIYVIYAYYFATFQTFNLAPSKRGIVLVIL